MPTGKVTFATVRKIATALPGVEEGTMYRSPAFKVRGNLLACIPVHRSAEPGSLAVRIGFEQREELLREDPAVFYLKDHYVNYPCVLVRLSRIHEDALRDLLGMGWRFVTAEKPRRKQRF